MHLLYFDCFSGISGDMTVGALLDAGADLEALRAALSSLDVTGYRIDAEQVSKGGIAATQFHVHLDGTAAQPKRHLRDVTAILEGGDLPAPVRTAALATFARLAEAEAKVHGTTPDKIHFHEVGALDAIIDIVAAHHALHQLTVDAVHASPLPVGFGTVQCDHGLLPVPAPATAELLKGAPTYGGDHPGEFVTPTGAAILRACSATFGPAPAMTVEAIGYGAGSREVEGRPNVLRVLLGKADAEKPCATSPITIVEANIDDMNPELLPPLLDALLRDGARDAFLTPILGKKGRPAHCVTVLCDAAELPTLTNTFFHNSSTLGLRIRHEQRVTLQRSWRKVSTPWGAVRVKTAALEGNQTNLAPEFEDCRAVADAAGVPVRRVYEAALAAALKGEFEDA